MSGPTPAHPPTGRTVPLTVLGGGGTRSRAAPRSSMGRWRTLVLVGVHLIILAHVAHWLWAGSTISPVEPSEAMYTLTEGELNAGFVFFALALCSTVIFGRLFCGWGCHVVALQDGSLWLLRKLGLRPSPFRSRLLLWFPLGLALYMFVWPKFKRLVAVPVFEEVWPGGLAYLGAAPSWTDLENAFIVEDFWASFPTLWVAIPFLFVIGFAVVYFLGAKGFCTYACPYGGFFAPLDRVSVRRIVVDHDKCKECGICTAVCTSNVRVSEEIKDFGAVVNPGCMKCLDCVSACPSDALSYAFAAPPLLATNPRTPDPASTKKRRKKPAKAATKTKWDLTWTQEMALAVFFMISFVSLRGLYGVIPMLFAGALAAIATWLIWKAWCSLTKANVRIHSVPLRRRGRYTPWGAGYLVLSAGMVVVIGHAALVSWHWSAGSLALSRVALLEPGPESVPVRTALYERAAARYERVNELGLASTPRLDFQLALVYAALNRPGDGEVALRRAIRREGEQDGLMVDLAELMRRQGKGREAETMLAELVEREPGFAASRRTLGAMYLEQRRVEDAVALFRAGVDARPRDDQSYAKLAEALGAAGRMGEAAEAIAGALAIRPEAAGYRRDYAIALFYDGQGEAALREMERAAEIAEVAWQADFYRTAAGFAQQLGRGEEARRLIGLADAAASRAAEATSEKNRPRL